MANEANATSLPGESASDTVLTLDDAANLNFEEADEATPEEEQEADIEQSPDDAEEEAEASGEEAEDETEETSDAEEEAEKPEPKIAADDALVVLDGKQVPVEELRKSYFRDKDYRHKTEELATKRRDLEATNERVTGTVNALVDFFTKHIPDEPDASLAYTNPNEYIQKKAAHDSAMAQIQEIIELGTKAKDTGKAMSDEQRREKLSSENAKLVERLPFLTDPAKRDDFNRKTFETAVAIGFTPEELNSSLDHRLLVLGHYARLGMEAEKAKGKAAQKAKNAPPVTPPAKRSARKDEPSRRNKEAMARLRKTGSIHDAMAIDFD